MSWFRTPLRSGWMSGLVAGALIGLLSSCSFTTPGPTPTPVSLPTYAPGATAGSTPQATATSATATPGSAAPDETAPETIDANAAPAEAVPASAAVDIASAAPAPAGAILYSGEIVAYQQVNVVAEVSGQVLELMVDVGTRVAAGDPVIRIDSTILEAQRAQALAGLEAAKAQYDLLVSEADDADIAAARAAVAAANAAYQRAIEGITDEDRRLAESQLRLAQAAVTTAQAAYNEVRWMPNIGAMPQSLQLQQATLQVEAAQAQYDKAVKGATQDVIAGAYAQLAQARAQLQRLEEGAKPEQIQSAQAQVNQAETALYLAQVQLSKATVRSPIDGVVSRVTTSAGSMAAPGAPLLVILSNEVKINIPVEETRLSTLRIGQPTRVRVDAYPDRVFNGTVDIIAPELDSATRTVQVTIRPQDEGRLLAPGMSATVELLEN